MVTYLLSLQGSPTLPILYQNPLQPTKVATKEVDLLVVEAVPAHVLVRALAVLVHARVEAGKIKFRIMSS